MAASFEHGVAGRSRSARLGSTGLEANSAGQLTVSLTRCAWLFDCACMFGRGGIPPQTTQHQERASILETLFVCHVRWLVFFFFSVRVCSM